MINFDKEIKRVPKKFQELDRYHKRVDEILQTIQEDCVPLPKRRTFVKVAAVMAVLFLAITGCLIKRLISTKCLERIWK